MCVCVCLFECSCFGLLSARLLLFLGFGLALFPRAMGIWTGSEKSVTTSVLKSNLPAYNQAPCLDTPRTSRSRCSIKQTSSASARDRTHQAAHWRGPLSTAGTLEHHRSAAVSLRIRIASGRHDASVCLFLCLPPGFGCFKL